MEPLTLGDLLYEDGTGSLAAGREEIGALVGLLTQLPGETLSACCRAAPHRRRAPRRDPEAGGGGAVGLEGGGGACQGGDPGSSSACIALIDVIATVYGICNCDGLPGKEFVGKPLS